MDKPISQDGRPSEYLQLQEQLLREQRATRTSAQRILQVVFQYLGPRSVLDVGCGLGTWLKVASEMGVEEVQGIEGPWLQPQNAEIDPKLIAIHELEKPFSLARMFDLVICLEVAEHLSPAVAESFVHTLTSHSAAVLFSAAIPFQGGTHHLNEQIPDYWARLFSEQGFATLDLVRPAVWKDDQVLWWYRQNVLLFASRDFVQMRPRLQRYCDPIWPLSIVHPSIFVARCAVLSQFQEFFKKMSGGGTFSVTPQPDGSMRVEKK